MYTTDDFEYGEFVRCEGKIMYVYSSLEDDHPGQYGLITEDTEVIYHEDLEMEGPDEKYYYPEQMEKLIPFRADSETMRRFFRLETTPWKLAEEGKYPFTDDSQGFRINEDDLASLVRHFNCLDSIVYDAWSKLFLSEKYAEYDKENPETFTLQMAWEMILDILVWFDPEEDESELVTEIWDLYCKSKGMKLEDIDFPDMYKSTVIRSIHNYSRKHNVSEAQKNLYIKLLDELCDDNDLWAMEHKAYAYYGGNHIVPCDWKKSEEMLLKLDERNLSRAANSLGYIYYSSRLGKPDYDKAYYYFSKAAANDITEAKYKLADMIRKGHGTKKDPDKAFPIYKELYEKQLKSFQQGKYSCKLADVALRMGYCYENGEGVPKDLHKAKEYFEIAKDAIQKRMKKHHFGDETVEKNINEALLRVQQI